MSPLCPHLAARACCLRVNDGVDFKGALLALCSLHPPPLSGTWILNDALDKGAFNPLDLRYKAFNAPLPGQLPVVTVALVYQL